MLRSFKELIDYVLAADDGHIGRCRDFLFDDRRWTVRYMVADTGKWIPNKKVLISPISLGEPDWASKLFRVNLTRKQIEQSPDIDSDAPVSREYETSLIEHFGFPPYWVGGGLWGAAAVPNAMIPLKGATLATDDRAQEPEHSLRSVSQVTGYYIEAKDGDIGHVEDFIVNDDTWAIQYIVVDTRNLLPGKKVLVAPDWVKEVRWSDNRMAVDLTREQIEQSPKYDPNAPINREFEERLYDFHGRPKYW